MFVVGTAGHVDHGKSSLVRALTGINPDRLREEQQREMTIDLGFAWVTLPSGREISVVDVPGHEDFIRNMLAGVGGIDLAVLVVAADESVMPQTREHLAILDLLKVPLGVVALTKADLIEDPDWLDLVVEELRETLAHSALADAPIVPVSSVTGQGLPELLSSIDTLLDSAQGRADLDMPRLPIDRVFSIAGFGTVVTGTLSGGRFRVGDAVEIVPGGLTARIRGLQAHKAKVEEAIPGMRVAVNLTGLDVSDISRGQVVAKPGVFRATSLVDARLRAVPESPIAIQHGMEVEFFSGSASVLGRVRLLDCDELSAGHSGWAQIVLREPVALARGDRFVIRLPSPSMTLGGGGLVEVHPVRRHRRLHQEVLSRLEALDTGDPAARLLALLEERGALAVGALSRECGLEPDDVRKALGDLLDRGAALVLGEVPGAHRDPAASGLALSRLYWDRTMERAEALLRAFHKAQPLRPGMPREEFRSRLGLTAEFASRLLARAHQEGIMAPAGDVVALAGHRAVLSDSDERAIADLMDQFRAQPYTPPGWSDVVAEVGERLAQYLVDRGDLVRLSGGVTFTPDAMDQMIGQLKEMGAGRSFSVAEVRDLFGASRKYVVAFLEEMDRRRITHRVGDERVLR